VPHQVQHRDRPVDGHRLDRPLAGEDTLRQHRNAPAAKLRQEALDRIGEAEAPFSQSSRPVTPVTGLIMEAMGTAHRAASA
jgi:hypothetical protein